MKHPARFSEDILYVAKTWLLTGADYTRPPQRILDPFAGTGRIHELGLYEHTETVGVEIEPEWAEMHPDTIVGDALDLPFPDEFFDAIFTSPVYGNRMSDHHEAKDASKRITYRHTLGRPLHPNNSGQLQWGPAYKSFHEKAWAEAVRVLRPGGRFLLNCKDHVRKGFIQHVTAWHVACLEGLGLRLERWLPVAAPGMRMGDNGQVRVDHEDMVLLTKP